MNVYVATGVSNAVAVFDRDSVTGALTEKAGHRRLHRQEHRPQEQRHPREGRAQRHPRRDRRPRRRLTGADVLESTLTTVPSASTAKSADDADTATHAAHADVATNIAAPEGFHEIGAPSEPAFHPGCRDDIANPAFQSVGF
jgi:hypothetical protein